MPDEIYELVAQGARYWFLFLMVLIAWRSWRWYRKDKKLAKKRRRLLPDAGFVGELVVVQGGGALERGAVLPVPREGTLGAMRTNDLCIPVAGVAKRHLWFRFDDGQGLMVEPLGPNALAVDGQAFQSRRQPLYMLHGSRLYVGEAELRLRLFAGFERIGHAGRRMDVEDEPPQADPAPEQAQIAAQQQAMQQMWLRQQWLMQQQAYQQGYQQAMAQRQEQPQKPGMADAYSYEAARAQGRVDDSAFMRPQGVPKPELPTYEPEWTASQSAPVQTEFATDETFFAPVMDEEEEWPELDGAFAEEDMTDAAAPPKSAYVGHDEAESAKKKVWDRYLGGGRR